MKAVWSITGFSVFAMVAVTAIVVGRSEPVRSEEVRSDAKIAAAVAATTTLVDLEPQRHDPHPQLQAELAHAVSALADKGDVRAKRSRGARCYHNCPPPVGSVTASPQVVAVPAGALGSATIHWRWDQSSAQAVTRHSCLWVSVGEESDAHLVQCEEPGHTYATNVGWIGAGNHIFRVAPGNPKGPFTKPVEGIFQLAQTIVVGVAH